MISDKVERKIAADSAALERIMKETKIARDEV